MQIIKKGCLTVHIETCNHLERNLSFIASQGLKAGVAINPHTPISLLEDIIEKADLVCLMAVNPGFGGQKFITRTLKKIEGLKKLILARNTHTVIQVDGGVNENNIQEIADAGADILVMGNAIVQAGNKVEFIKKMSALINT